MRDHLNLALSLGACAAISILSIEGNDMVLNVTTF